MQNSPRPFCKLKVYKFRFIGLFRYSSVIAMSSAHWRGNPRNIPETLRDCHVGLRPPRNDELFGEQFVKSEFEYKQKPGFCCCKSREFFFRGDYCILMAYWMELTLPSSKITVRVPTSSEMI